MREFLQTLSPRERSRVLALLERAADEGPPRNQEKSRPIVGTRLFEFKLNQSRIFWRWTRNNQIVLLHAFTKQQQRTPQSEIHIALDLYDIVELELRRNPNAKS